MENLDKKKETKKLTGLRLAKMGFTAESPTPEEVSQVTASVLTIKRISRFGYQIPAYLLTAQPNGEFSGIVMPGTQSQISSIWSTLDHIREKYGEQIEQLMPGSYETGYINAFRISPDAKLSEITRRSEQRIVLIKSILKDPNGAVLALGVPAIDTMFYGYPPYSAHSNRSSNALQLIEFENSEARQKFEESLLGSKEPLKLLKNLYSVLFSPDNCPNLIGVNDSRKVGYIIQGGNPVGYNGGIEEAISDLAGLGFHYGFAEERGGNSKPLVT